MVSVLANRVSLEGDNLIGVCGVDDVQLDLVDTSVKSARALGEVVLAGSRRDREQKVDAVTVFDGDTLNVA
jgi:hypothetical protein